MSAAGYLEKLAAAVLLDNPADSSPGENRFFAFFHADARSLRQLPAFHQLVRNSGLLDYWKKWGWSDYC